MFLHQHRRNVIYFPAEKKWFYNGGTGTEVHYPRDKSALQNLVNMQIAVELTRRNQKLFPVQWIAADITGKYRITPDDHITDNLII